MKKIFPLLILTLPCIIAHAQDFPSDFWKIKWNKKVILEAKHVNEVANVRQIKAKDLEKNYLLEVSYKKEDAKAEKDWIRSFLIFDENDRELLRKDSTRDMKITAAQLKKLFGNKKKIKIYTIAIPSDPDMAARVRVRRVHLCTLQLQ